MTKRRRKAILLISLAALAAAGFVFLLHRRGALLDRATKIADVQGWERLGTRGSQRDCTYQWVRESEVLIARRDVEHKLTFYLRDLAAGTETPLVKLSDEYNGFPATSMGNVAQLSPDSRWILWEGSLNGQLYRLCATLDGSQLVKFPWDGSDSSNYISWLNDSARWVEEAFTLPVRDRYNVRVHALSDPEKPVDLPCYQGKLDPNAVFLLLTAANRALVSPVLRKGVSARQQIERLGLQEQITPLTRPFDDVFKEMPLFQDVSSNRSGEIAVLKISGGRERVVVSLPDGSRRNELGSVPASDMDHRVPGLFELRWLPDGKHLSFIYQNTLYSVPAF